MFVINVHLTRLDRPKKALQYQFKHRLYAQWLKIRETRKKVTIENDFDVY